MAKKAVIMAAGRGVRMGDLTDDIPKHIIPINGKPFLLYLIENLKKAGFTDFGIVVCYKQEKIKEFLEKNRIKAVLIEQEEPLGTGHAVEVCRNFTKNDNFVVVNGDNLYSVDDLSKIDIEDDFNYVFGIEVEDPSKYGVLVAEGEKLKKIVEKPAEFVGKLINTGLYKFTPEIYDALEMIQISERGEYELTDAISILARDSKVNVVKLKDFWKDLGKPEDIPEMSKFLSKQGF